MRIRRFLGLCSILVATVPSMARAQDVKKVGITMGYPAAVGVLWHVTDKVAIRPEIAFAGSSTTTSGSGVDISGDGWNIGTGVSAIFYLRKYDHLRTYVSPRFTYGHQSSSSTTSGLPISSGTSPTYSQTSETFGGFGMFGAQYWLGLPLKTLAPVFVPAGGFTEVLRA